MCRVGGKSKAVESVVATCGYPPVAPRTFVLRDRRKLYCISPVEIAGLVTNRAVNEIDLPLAMQMDPTTLQLIQFLERTVSSGECVASRTIVPSSATSHAYRPARFSRSSVPSFRNISSHEKRNIVAHATTIPIAEGAWSNVAKIVSRARHN